MKGRSTAVMLLLAAVLYVAGCARAPIQEMSDARRAVSMARDAGASVSVAAGFARAATMVQAARRALDAGDYHAARSDALAGKRLAVSVRALSLALASLQRDLALAHERGKTVDSAAAVAREASEAAGRGQVELATRLIAKARDLIFAD